MTEAYGPPFRADHAGGRPRPGSLKLARVVDVATEVWADA
jgi:hypothetical protein